MGKAGQAILGCLICARNAIRLCEGIKVFGDPFLLKASIAQKGVWRTLKYVGEGFDCPILDTLVITMPIEFRGKVAQYTGRTHLLVEGKGDVYVYDYAVFVFVSLLIILN